ncbi:glycogen debranching protein GlgX [Aestuariivirga sp.]|uniref:glycogen debranching protein GlgX n=1 Tax=Aestuariivirga sp. TaxID=2650926 RepID=UPI0039E5532C
MTRAGSPFPLGVTLGEGGANVAVVSRHATRILFCIFDEEGEEELYRFPLVQRLGDVHYGFISGLTAGTRYGLRAEGPWDEAEAHRFDSSKLLIDPYARALDRSFVHVPEILARGEDTAFIVPKCIVTAEFAAAAPLPPARPGFIYEIQVKAFTKLHPDVPEQQRGTVAALAHPSVIAHLKKLAVDTVELMPLAAWMDERHLTALNLSNAWGYNPVTFMAPDPRLAPGGFGEIRAAVAALHEAGIRVVLDVVFNHTGESDERGSTLSLRGLDNALYYRHANGLPVNDTGCGNTLALERAPVMKMAMDAMRLWASQTGIDGFRFDLAPVMGRTAEGFTPDAPLLGAIAQDPVLSKLIMIAEPWDVGPGGYRLGQFPAAWGEWNDHYRDDVRRFWRGDQGMIGGLATRLAGSSDVFGSTRRPSCSVNFLSAHDGFTLKDSVTYAAKNNFANGENNRDGNGGEPTWVGGDARALLATLFFSRGTPMLTAGDEFGRTQKGNNNAYAQDNATTWLDWKNADQELIAFTSALSALRKAYPQLTDDRFLTGQAADGRFADAQWVGGDGRDVDWNNPAARVLGLVLAKADHRIAVVINGGSEPLTPVLPPRDGWRWSRVFSSAAGDGVPAKAVALFEEKRSASSGISDDTLARLADAAGIERDWWEVDGTHHTVTPDTQRALLTALRIAHGTADEAEASLRDLASRKPPLLGLEGADAVIGGARPQRQRMVITGEDGAQQFIDVMPGETPRASLDTGYYTVSPEDQPDELRRLIISPDSCFLPERPRSFGLAAHLYSLRHDGDGGIGDFGTLRRFAEKTASLQGAYTGINPLHHLFPQDRERASPYQPSDRRFIDPIYISISAMLDALPLPKTAKRAASRRAAFATLEKLSNVDYTAVWKAKSELLEQAFAEFSPTPDFNAFVKAGGDLLARHCAYETKAAGEPADPKRHSYRAFLQWLADTQLGDAAQSRSLYRDLALGCAFDGGEMADAPELFAKGVSIGAPPDPFSAAGQVWNLPPFSPLALEQQSFAPMRTILSANMRHAAALRIDHVLGFMRQFWVPEGAEGRFGAYVRFPLDALIAVTAIESTRARCLVVGEDLGTVPDGLRGALDAADVLSYRVLWFERNGAGFKSREAYPPLSLACLASHDLPTFKGWRAGRDIAIDRELGLISEAQAKTREAMRKAEIAALDRTTGAASEADAAPAAHGFVAGMPSRIMLVQADDLAGETEPLNVPGTDRERPNWRRRIHVPVDEIGESVEAKAILARVTQERPS